MDRIFYQNLHDFKTAILAELQERKDISFQIKDLECGELKVSDDVSLVFGSVAIRGENPQETVKINMDSRFSILYKKVNGRWIILHIHQSIPNQEQIGKESYPKTLIAQVETAHEMIESLTELAAIDSLTGLMNIRAFREKYVSMDKKDAWFFVMDIDDFKEINDRQGHLQGNRALVNLSTILSDTVREHDLICRLGGDEFILLCTGMKSERAVMKLAERLLANVQARSQENPPLISISIGFTRLKEDESFEEVFERADRALYESKQRGKGKASADY